MVRARLRLLNDYLRDLRSLQTVDVETYEENVVIRRAVERTLQLAAEASLDIGQHIIALEGFRTPNDNKDVFVVLGEEGVLSADLVSKLIQMARFRNLLVHDYARIDDRVVYGILRDRLSDFDTYARAIVQHVTDHP